MSPNEFFETALRFTEAQKQVYDQSGTVAKENSIDKWIAGIVNINPTVILRPDMLLTINEGIFSTRIFPALYWTQRLGSLPAMALTLKLTES